MSPFADSPVSPSQQAAVIDVRPAVNAVPSPAPFAAAEENAPLCYSCGNTMQRAGSCYVCSSCGSTSGCS